MGHRVLVVGAGGRMGHTVCHAVLDDPELDLVAAVDPSCEDAALSELLGRADTDVTVAGAVTSIGESVDVAVDFTVVAAARETLAWCAANAVHAVVGTTGFDDADLGRFDADFSSSNILIAPNFAIGAVLMMRFAELAAPFFETAEVIELHHENKIDAPSGTARRTLERMAAASHDWLPDPTQDEVISGARGGVGPGNIPVHSVRLRGMVAHQEVLLGTTGQSLTVRHDSYDRSSFMPGVIHACKVIGEHPGLTVGLDSYLGL